MIHNTPEQIEYDHADLECVSPRCFYKYVSLYNEIKIIFNDQVQ